MKPNLDGLAQNLVDPPASPRRLGAILRLVKSDPEQQAIASGQVDAVIDPASGEVFLLPDAQQALQEDHARLRSLLALSVDWFWEQDENYRFVSHSTTVAENTAPYDGGIIGKLLWELPFDNMLEADWVAHRQQLKWRFTVRDLELRCTDHSGKTRWVSISAEPVFDQDRFKGYRGTMRDITQRMQSATLVRVDSENITEPEEERPQAGRKAAKITTANSVLAALPHKDLGVLLANLSPVTLTYGEVLYEPGEKIRYVYFPSDCLVSLLTTVEGHQALEVGLVGSEGMVGISLALGVGVSPVRALVQGSGTALRMSTASFVREFRSSLALQKELYRFTFAKLSQARQTAACNRFHPVDARLSRWLLMTADRMRSNQFLLTQAFLADMLGVRRAGVTVAAADLQRRNLIDYSRGTIRILDRKGLEGTSCECYESIKAMHCSIPRNKSRAKYLSSARPAKKGC
jgi:PAS domain S-box-containing protein